MKKFYLFSCLILTGFISHAQIGKGTIILGGNLEYDESAASDFNNPATKSTGLTINPSFGKAIKNNLVLGFDVTYGHATSSEEQDYNQTSNSFGAGVFLRKYKSLGNGFYLFGQSRIGGGYSHGSITNPNTTGNPVNNVSNGYNLSLQFYPGIAYAIDRRWQIEIGLPNFLAVNYSHSKETLSYIGQPDELSTSHDFNVASSLTGANDFSVGIRYFIGGTAAH
jgi:hypothetical protein